MKNPELEQITIRPEAEADYDQIDGLVVEAFNGRSELAPFVRTIRESLNYVPRYALIAEQRNRVIGHVMLSYTELRDGDDSHRVLTLSPLSVAPGMQRRGVGGKLVNNVLALADKDGEPLVVLEGSPEYYPRFGFLPAASHGITMSLPDWAPPEAAMVRPLTGDNRSIRGHVVYPPAFDLGSD